MSRTLHLSAGATLFHADCRDALRALPDNCIDSGVTDPPYALVSTLKRFANSPRTEASMPTAGPYERASRGFMGQTWDTGETAFSVDFWTQVLRVLKPGGHLVAFGASRGYHRMACAIEDAGFEVRDSLAWLYGTGFPKSHDVSKGVDKTLGAEGGRGEFKSDAHAASAAKGVRTQTGIAIHDRPWMQDPDALDRQAREYVPATPEAAAWEGWGTALKPAFEPIVLARKPLSEGTVAANVLRWGTGALNVGATRIEAGDKTPAPVGQFGGSSIGPNGHSGIRDGSADGLGRWPANVVHDGSAEVLEAFPTSPGQLARSSSSSDARKTQNVYGDMRRGAPGTEMEPRGDSGSAARFFYSAKASKADRNGSKHPTVKPVALMQWLARLVTPPGGVILDPFAGSGTTGAAARAEGFRIVMCEREAEYVRDIAARYAIIS